MTNILDKILDTKVSEVIKAKSIKPIDLIKDEINQMSKPRDFIGSINISSKKLLYFLGKKQSELKPP